MKKALFCLMVTLVLSLFGCATLESSLQDGVLQNNEQAVNDALNKGADPNLTDLEENPLIVLAVQQGSVPVTKRLIQAGANVNATDKNGWTSLMWASARGDSELVKMLVDAGADVNPTGEKLDQPPYIVSKCVGFNCPVSRSIGSGMTALIIACKYGHINVVKILLDAKANTDIQGENGNTALIEASRNGYINIVKLLISAGADLDIETADGHDALEVAQIHKQVEVEKLILARTTKLKALSLQTSLIIASIKGYTDVVKEIISRKKVDINAADYFGETALIYATEHGHAEIVKMLISAGANPNDRDHYGKTALMLASEEGDVDTVKVLLAGGADVNARFTNDGDQTVLQRAVLFGQTEVVKILLAKGAKVNAKDKSGFTALDEAYNHPEVAKILKAAGGKKAKTR